MKSSPRPIALTVIPSAVRDAANARSASGSVTPTLAIPSDSTTTRSMASPSIAASSARPVATPSYRFVPPLGSMPSMIRPHADLSPSADAPWMYVRTESLKPTSAKLSAGRSSSTSSRAAIRAVVILSRPAIDPEVSRTTARWTGRRTDDSSSGADTSTTT